MKIWKVLFIGIGSIAKRHIKNLTVLMEQRKEKLQIDAFRSSKGYLISDDTRNYITEVYYSEEKVPEDYDVVFVTNPTQMHLQAIERFCQKGRHFFIEKVERCKNRFVFWQRVLCCGASEIFFCDSVC